jgi:hypothetical protein
MSFLDRCDLVERGLDGAGNKQCRAALAPPGEVRVSQTVKDMAAGSGITFEDRGLVELKGAPVVLAYGTRYQWHVREGDRL